jgi:hypothetical protein
MIRGRWNKENYDPIPTGSQDELSGPIVDFTNAKHPIFEGVKVYEGGGANFFCTGSTSHKEIVIDDMYPNCAYIGLSMSTLQ